MSTKVTNTNLFRNRNLESTRPVVEETRRITINELQAQEALRPGYMIRALVTNESWMPASYQIEVVLSEERETGSIEFSYSRNNEPVSYQHEIEFFSCNFGGYRFYFVCRDCRMRVTALYLVHGYFACRHCHRLVYRACREHRNPLELLHRSRDLKARAKSLKRNGHPRKAGRLNDRAFRYEWMSYRILTDYLEHFGEKRSTKKEQIGRPSHRVSIGVE